MDKLILIDGNSLLNRAFYAIPPLNDKKGRMTNAVFGFVNMLVKLVEDERPKYLVTAFDLPAPTFRAKLYADYKATRKPMPADLRSQVGILKELLTAMGVAIVEKEGYEADDVLGTLAKSSAIPVVIVTGDRDCYQLIDDNTTVYLTRHGLSEILRMDGAALFAEYGFTPDKIVDLKGLMGDASDNIPGVPGVGEKTALKLLAEYGSLSAVLDSADGITGTLGERLRTGRDSARLSYALATIDTSVPLDLTGIDFALEFPFPARVRDAFIELNFNSLVKKKIFADGDTAPAENIPKVQYGEITITDAAELSALRFEGSVGFIPEPFTVIADGKIYRASGGESLLDAGLDTGTALAAFEPVLTNPAIKKYVYDFKAVLRTLAAYGKRIEGAFDVLLAQYVADSTVKNSTLADLLLVRGLSNPGGLLELGKILEREIEPRKHLYYDIDFPLSALLLEMEDYGFRIDLTVLNALSEKYMGIANSLAEKIYGHAGEKFNINSPKQLGEILFNKLNLPHGKKTQTGYSTSAEVLDALRGEPIVDNILEYRSYTKLVGTYIEGFRGIIDTRGYVHTRFNQALTSTGRLSSTEPNLQNLPIRTETGREIRRMFVPSPGNILISADYSQIELRLMAHLSGEEGLIESFKAGEDIHRRTASEVFGVPLEAVTSEQRRAAKAVNFGIIYGISDWGLSTDLGIPVSAAHKYIQRYFILYPKVKAFMDESVRSARERGYAEAFTGRIRVIPELKSDNRTLRSFGERAAMNMPLQGAAADLIKIAMLNVSRRLKAEKLAARLILSVHDELVIDSPLTEADRVESLLKAEMEKAMSLSVPLKVETSRGESLYKT